MRAQLQVGRRAPGAIGLSLDRSRRGMKYEWIADSLATKSRKKLTALSEKDFDCKDCNMRWEVVMERLLLMVEELPPCPLPVE
jgi:hypothetical protein